MAEKPLVCGKCGRALAPIKFFKTRNGEYLEQCKECITMRVDNFDPDTFLWLLERMDFPYIAGEWNKIRNTEYEKNPDKFKGTSVIGKYVSKMRLGQWKKYGYADSEQLAAEKEAKAEEAAAAQQEYADKIQQQFDNGDITEAEYRTLMPEEDLYKNEKDNYNYDPRLNVPAGGGSTQPMGINFFNEENFFPEEEMPNPGKDLDHDEKVRLAVKWGRTYTPNDWLTLESNYLRMKKSFNIDDADSENTLLILCKTHLKMEQAIDSGDIDGYLKLSKVYESLRKSAKFTAAQNKEGKNGAFEAVCQIVEFCEREGGFIPQWDIPTPMDIVDKNMVDLEKYNSTLIEKDPTVFKQIENYIKKREILEAQEKAKAEAEARGEEYVMLTDSDLAAYHEHEEEQRDEDAEVE